MFYHYATVPKQNASRVTTQYFRNMFPYFNMQLT